MKRIRIAVPVAAAVISAVIMMAALIIHPLIGVADNGDFYRSINGQGIYKLDRYESDQYYQFFSSKYGAYEYFNESEKSLLSVQNLYIKAAQFFDALFTSDKSLFDIRFMSVFLIIQLAMGVYLLVDYITWKKPLVQKILLSGICIIMFVDTAYTAYFNSFYAEGIVYVTFLLLTACAFLLTQNRYQPYRLLLLMFVNGILLIFTKQQNATAGAVLCFLFLIIAYGFGMGKGMFWKVCVGGAVCMGVAGVIMYVSIPAEFVGINQYHAMTRGALMTGENPEKTLAKFGIDEQYSILDGTIYFERYPSVDPESEQLKQNFYNQYDFVSLVTYYLTHLDELMVILNKAANNGYMIRPEALGNYERMEGRTPGDQTEFFTFYSYFKKNFIPNTVGFVGIWMLVICGCSFQDRKKFMVVISTIFMGLIQVGTSIIGAGDADLSKHIFLYNVAFDLVSFVCFAPLLTNWILLLFQGFCGWIQKRKKALILFLFPCFLLGYTSTAHAAAKKEPEIKQMVILCPQGEDTQVLEDLVKACGLDPVVVRTQSYNANNFDDIEYVITTTELYLDEIKERELTVLCLGPAAKQIPETKVKEYQNRTTWLSYGVHREGERFEEQMTVIASSVGGTIGSIQIGENLEAPFAVKAKDGNYYVPYYQKSGISKVLLGAIIQQMANHKEEGRMYFVLDEVYPFSDLEKICSWADTLYENGIPFLVRVMPIYDNLDYPAFTRYAQVLSYIQQKGGTIVLHEALVIEAQIEVEPLEDKIERFLTALKAERIYGRQMEQMPYLFSLEELKDITTERKNFGTFAFDSMIGINADDGAENFEDLVTQINNKWFSFTDYQKEFTSVTYRYSEKELPKDFVFREKEEAKLLLFFSASDRILLGIVGISLVILTLFLWIGGKWYRRKFYK